MRSFAQFLTEAPTFVDNLTVRGEDVEVFRDPTSVKDLLSVAPISRRRRVSSCRALITPEHVYYWDEDVPATHTEIQHRMPELDEALPVYLYVQPDQRVELAVAWISVDAYGPAAERITTYAKTLLTTHPSLRSLRATYTSESDG